MSGGLIVDNNLFILPPPDPENESLQTPVFFFVNQQRMEGLLEITDDGFVLVYEDERLVMQPEWNIVVTDETAELAVVN